VVHSYASVLELTWFKCAVRPKSFTSWIVISIRCFSHILVSHFVSIVKMRLSALMVMERQVTKDRLYRYEYLMAKESYRERKRVTWRYVPHVSSGKVRSVLKNLLLAVCCRQYSHFNNCATFFILKQTRKRVKNCHACNKVYYIKNCKKNVSCNKQEEREKSMQHEENMKRVGDLEAWA